METLATNQQYQKDPFIFNTWFISILFLLWPLYAIPLVIGIVLAILKTNRDKKKLQLTNNLIAEYERLDSMLTPEVQDAIQLQLHVEQLNNESSSISATINFLNLQLQQLQQTLADKQKELVQLDDEILVQSFGLYKPQYDFASSLDYREELAKIRAVQKEMIKAKTAVTGSSNWTVDGNKTKGKKMVSDTQKLLLRAFNTECDDIISKVRYTNFDSSLSRIYKLAESISKLGTIMSISVTPQYLDAKIKELRLAFEYQQKKQREKEEAKAARDEQREQARLQKEIDEQKKRIEKEQTHYQTAYEKLQSQLKDNPDDEQLLKKKEEFENKLEDIDKALNDIDYRQANMRAGYVYVISNIGSFGENIYKIGMTRRLDPQDRVDELGDASVPFRFDVHAMIFSDDAPALEAALHRAFEDKKVNMVNHRREFFHVTLDEIKEVIKANFDKTVEFVDVPDAEQYRVSEKMRNEGIACEV